MLYTLCTYNIFGKYSHRTFFGLEWELYDLIDDIDHSGFEHVIYCQPV